MKRIIMVICLLIPFQIWNVTNAADDPYDIGVVEKLGAYVPLNVTFTDEKGEKVLLKDLVKRPTLLAFVYYKCPGICTPVLTELANVVGKVDLTPGEDYSIVTISIDQNEKPADAIEKRNDIIGFTGKYIEPGGWSFLTGDSVNIKLVTESAGYLFKRVGNNFIHSDGFVFITKDGKICRYLYPDYTATGQFSILPFDFKMAYLETAQGQQVKTMSKLIKFCFSYDPKGRTYVFNITRVSGALILIFTTLFVVFVVVKPKKKKIL